MFSNKKRRATEEGTFTIYHEDFGENYHSTTGSVTEANHVYITNGLEYFLENFSEKNIFILEVGFGSGLNLLLSYLKMKEKEFQMTYHAIESDPLSWKEVSTLGFQKYLRLDETEKEFFQFSHQSPWDSLQIWDTRCSFLKKNTRFEDMELPLSQYHIVYFDAFSPESHKSAWAVKEFQKIKRSMHKGQSLLVTYCCKGWVKQNFRQAGFELFRLKGAPPKHHMLRACPY